MHINNYYYHLKKIKKKKNLLKIKKEKNYKKKN